MGIKDAAHIGMVVNLKNSSGTNYLVVHNIGTGQQIADCLFECKIIGHYRYSNGQRQN